MLTEVLTCPASDFTLAYQRMLLMIFFPNTLDDHSKYRPLRFYLLPLYYFLIKKCLCAIIELVAGNATVTGADLAHAHM